MTGMYFMAKIKEPHLRSATLQKCEETASEKESERLEARQNFKWVSVTLCGYYDLIRDRPCLCVPFTRTCVCVCMFECGTLHIVKMARQSPSSGGSCDLRGEGTE